MQLDDAGFQERLVAALNEDDGFVLETHWYDGSILIEAGAQRCWLKVYRGKVIDHLPFVPPLGYTFKVSGSQAAWDLLISGERTFTDLATPGSRHCSSIAEIESGGGGERPPELAIEGNGFEAGRMHVALLHLAGCIKATASLVAA
jgi:hypothetical protein